MPDIIKTELWQLIPTVIYFGVGLILFCLAIWVMAKLAPFSVTKEIEEDQNASLAILMGSTIIGLAILLSAVLK